MGNITTELWLLLDLAIAAVLGFVIGFERKLRFKEAGIRTHTIVCVGSALMMAISKYAFKSDYDSSRVAAQIVSGVGFLGAGMIVYRHNGVSGLTTAAGVWTAAGVGMACGGRMYVLAVGATAIIVALQCLFHVNCKAFNRKKYYTIKISFTYADNSSEIIKDIFKVDRFTQFIANRTPDGIVYKAKLVTTVEYTAEQVNAIVEKYPFIVSMERTDSE
ncbi:MAG: MgtC/SapB family protein [Clostridia bacterium]|nr:MgtC/SapB family protein [Clostridia bacterium]